MIPKDAQKIRELIAYLGETYTIFLCTPLVNDLCQMCEEIIILQNGALKTIAPADQTALMQEYSAASAENTPDEVALQKSKSTRWSMLTQKGADYEVIDDEKEGKN